jgi:hypothetical protein
MHRYIASALTAASLVIGVGGLCTGAPPGLSWRGLAPELRLTRFPTYGR